MNEPIASTSSPAAWLDDAGLAELLGVGQSTVRRWRALGTAPAWTRVGRRVRYSPDAVAAWLASRTTSAGSVSAS